MSYLLYCIYRGPLPAALELPEGIGGQRVFTAHYNGLGSALSTLAEPDSPPDIPMLLSYEMVVESFYRHLTVIPMRYGCQVGCPSEAVVLLRENQDTYGALLDELEGLAEMSIQLLLETPGAATGSNLQPVARTAFPLPGDSGAAYLAAKRQRYLGLDRAGREQHELVKELCDSLDGSFVRHKVEFPSFKRGHLLSLYFLVPRDSVENFRRTALRLPQNQTIKLLLSGPWPPYNFVESLGKAGITCRAPGGSALWSQFHNCP
jgi:hypothetical protein